MKRYIEEFLRKSAVKRFATDDLEKFLIVKLKREYAEQGGYDALCTYVGEIEMQGIIRPVKARDKNGLYPSLYNWYQIQNVKEEVDEEIIRKVLNGFHPRMSMVNYVHDQRQLQKDIPYLKAVDAFFRTNKGEYSLSINERSFELFKDEKWMVSKSASELFQRIKVDISDFNCYTTPEPFFYVRKNHGSSQNVNVLIVENKDTFHTLRLLFKEGIHTWAGVTFHMLIYGEGKKIIHSIDFINDIEELNGLLELNGYYYGDIDPEGISIFSGLKKKNKLKIQPFIFFYEELLKKYQNEENIKRKKEQERAQGNYADFFVYFDEKTKIAIESIVSGGNYLPQEGLNRKDFYEMRG